MSSAHNKTERWEATVNERNRYIRRGVLAVCAIVAASASCEGLGGKGGAGGDGGQGGNGPPSTYCTNTPAAHDPILDRDIPADSIEQTPTYYSDVTFAGGCIHRFPNAFIVEGGAKVTIEAGAVIEIGGGKNSNDIYITEGALIAEGTAAAPVEFRPAAGESFGGIYLNDVSTISLRHAFIHDATHGLTPGGADSACLTIYGEIDTLPKGIVIEDTTFERCARAGIVFGTDLEDEATASAIAGMYSSFTRNQIIDSEYGFLVYNESLIAGIKEMPKTSGVKAHVADNIYYKKLDLTLLDGGIPWWGASVDLLEPTAKFRLEPGVVFEVHDIFFNPAKFSFSGVGELFLDGTADKPIVISVDPGLHSSPGLVSAVKSTLRNVRLNGMAMMEIGKGGIVENVTHENCAVSDSLAFRVLGDDVTFAANTIRNCPVGIRTYQQFVSRVGAGNVYEKVDHNQLDLSGTSVGTTSWIGQSVPWLFDDIDISGTLTLGPGVHLRGRDGFLGSGVLVNIGAKLIAQGTAAQLVRFDGQDTGINSWDGITLNGTGSADLTYVDMSEAHAGVRTDDAPVTITNSMFHDNEIDVYTSCAPAIVTASTVMVKKDAVNCP